MLAFIHEQTRVMDHIEGHANQSTWRAQRAIQSLPHKFQFSNVASKYDDFNVVYSHEIFFIMENIWDLYGDRGTVYYPIKPWPQGGTERIETLTKKGQKSNQIIKHIG